MVRRKYKVENERKSPEPPWTYYIPEILCLAILIALLVYEWSQ